MPNRPWFAVLLFLVAACGTIGKSSSPGDDEGSDDDDDDTLPLPEGYLSLLEGGWLLEPGEEAYHCVYQTVPRDVYLKGFRPLNPDGTHHTVLTVLRGNDSTPDGIVPCSSATNGQNMIFGSGIGAPDFDFPAGVGLHLTAGTRLLLNLHLFNATDAPLAGRSGTLFREATASEIEHVAELVLAGPVGFSIPAPSPRPITGTCSLSNIIDQPAKVFALSQHMHKLGRNLKSTIRRPGAVDIVLQDTPYDFEEQIFHFVDEIEILPGDSLVTECTYDNDTGRSIPFGESSDDEMCFTDLFYYPAQGANFLCPF
jgi:hypothetical protein